MILRFSEQVEPEDGWRLSWSELVAGKEIKMAKYLLVVSISRW